MIIELNVLEQVMAKFAAIYKLFLRKVGIISEPSWMISYVRSFYPMMIVEQLVGVQPMVGPVGEIFNIHYSYYEYNGELDNWGSYLI